MGVAFVFMRGDQVKEKASAKPTISYGRELSVEEMVDLSRLLARVISLSLKSAEPDKQGRDTKDPELS